MGAPENAVQRQCLQLLRLSHIPAWRSNNAGVFNRKAGCYTFHGTPGVADILAVLPPSGRLLTIECKSATGKQTDAQRDWAAEISAAGASYVVIRDIAELQAALRQAAGNA